MERSMTAMAALKLTTFSIGVTIGRPHGSLSDNEDGLAPSEE